MGDQLDNFREFMKQREEAARAYVNGDPQPLEKLVTTNSPATFFGPKGQNKEGAADVLLSYKSGATSFDSGSETHFEVLHMEASDGLAFWTGFQKASIQMLETEEMVPMNIRVTEIFRQEDGEWKMVHRHADMGGKQ
ncbi:MAG TPA: nuclear transport factor 2 family protein [Pyrinomonadaceae bacterium]|jgi:ketosteroid isomerase-like protein|nr:nuclear transport factor 2 family protein [Pyrinomonadaceae bacterium]